MSARRDPAWLNQATVKGVVLVLAAGAIMSTSESEDAFTIILGLLLVGWGLAEIWFRLYRKAERRKWSTVALPLTLLVVGVLLLADPGPAIPVLVGIAVTLRGLVLFVRAIRDPEGSRRMALSRAGVTLVAGLIILFLPETFVLGVRLAGGILGIILGVILIARGLRSADEQELREIDTTGAGRLAREWLDARRLDADRKDEISETLFFEEPHRAAKLTSFWVMMLLATAIASFAVIQDSTAVVIGAMLVAPLMTPIMGIAAGMVNGWPARMTASVFLVVVAVAAAIAVAWLIAGWLPSVGDLTTNAQVTSRTSPSLIDLAIAVAAGAAGAYATIDPRVSSSLSGVAIAVALVPPLAVVGITLQEGMGEDSFGAFLLFFTNFVSIVLTGAVVFVLTGYSFIPLEDRHREAMWRILGPVLLGALLILIPLSLTSAGVWTETGNTADTEDAVNEWLAGARDLQSVSIDVDGRDVEVVLSGSDDPPSVETLQSSLDETFGKPVTLTVRLVPSELVGS